MSSSFKIAIIGVGQVGGAAAYALILSSIAGELLLVETNTEKRYGQVQDLSDAVYSTNSSTRVRAATYREAAQCDIVIITVASKQIIGQTTLDYTSRNIWIIRDVINAMTPFRSDAILLIVAHPVDLLTSLAQKLSKLPASQVLGSGTMLESMRLRGLLSDRTGVAPSSINVNVVGVHGETQVIAWSTATIGGNPVDRSLYSNTAVNGAEIEEECMARLQSIIKAKGASPFGIGSVLCSLCTSILLNKGTVCPISHFQPDFGCYMSLPAVIGRKGVVETLQKSFTPEEEARIAESGQALAKRVEWAWQEFA